MQIPKDHLKLHFIVVLNSFVPLILNKIELLDPEVIVFYRMLSAFLLISLFLYVRKENFIKRGKEALQLLSSGLLLAAYWSFLILSVKEGNVSVALVGMATTSLWISFIEPTFFGVKSKPFQSLIGINAIIGIYVIFQSDFEYGRGLAFGLTGSFFSALVTIFSSQLSRKHRPMVITLYQMVGGWIGMTIFLIVYANFFATKKINMLPSWNDIALILGLVLVFSIYAYTVFIEVIKTVSAFTVSLVSNLSPIYGILFAVVFTEEAKTMTKGFVAGAMMLLFSVFAYPILMYYLNKFQKTKDTPTTPLPE
jgi:drug/metabolite transporter (DMT)-like permease